MKTPIAIFVFSFLLVHQSTVQATLTETISALCPIGCRCSPSTEGTGLTVDCLGAPHVDREQLSEQLDSLLSSNQTYGHLTQLNIINSRLTHVPRSVCRLTTLTQLHLDFNRLTRLPDNCLTNLTALTSLSASRNNITELQDGLFDGLSKLQTLQLSINLISSIGLRVFNGSAMLTSLRDVYLSLNRIQTLEPWFYYVVINGRPLHGAHVSLDVNNISSFTNLMGWKAKCGMTRPTWHFELVLSHNPIRHISDILHGWNMSLLTYLCLFKTVGSPNSQIRLSEVKLYCDCVDFNIFRTVLNPWVRMGILHRVFCGEPWDLYNKKVTSVPLDQFVCELTERCPSGCRCVHRPANATLHIYCSSSNLTVLPRELPELPKSYTKYKLDLSNNRLLRRLEHRDYFVNTSILDVSNCNLDSIDFKLWNDLANITQIFLDGNQIQSLPSRVARVSLKRSNFSLGRNPWQCSCGASWMPKWLKTINSSLIDQYAVICSSPSRLRWKNIVGISKEDFCVNPVSEAVKRALIIALSTVAGVAVALLSIGFISHRLRVRLNTRWKFHPFDRDECQGEDMDYDVFLSTNSSDNLPHGNGIREQLEQRGYRVCYPPRDFLAGALIYDNIYNAVVRSKRTVCFLTVNFLQR